ncbi:hypothetical protein Tco_1284829 [Tanacetum coccineum]
MGVGSTLNSQFPGFSSQAPMTPEQQAFFESQQAAFVAFQQDFQNGQQNPPQFEMPQQQSQSSNSLSQTESQPKKGRIKRTAKKGKSSEPIGDITLRWTSDEETLLAECFIAVSEDRNVGRSQPRDTLWPRGIYQDKNKNGSFNHEKAWAVLRKHTKWDAPDPAPVDLTEDENVHDEHVPAVNTDELFGPNPRPRPPSKQCPGKKTKSDTSSSTGGSNSSSQFGDFMSHELRLKREAAEKAFEASKDKDQTITRLEELRFLALSMKDLSPDDAVACTIVGVVVLLLLHVMAKKAYVTENALMPGIIEDVIQVGLL